ncbi:hypothetical protein E2C01_062191 [Portunus trituberculatus]|uniref:Uncharacterized protein n=1 Tax=Portunus trituberculatus TaxID=210409 RepID=A0A5B7HAA7_PORTR|nr:hypothetical protein [Portunus trituberculatus]
MNSVQIKEDRRSACRRPQLRKQEALECWARKERDLSILCLFIPAGEGRRQKHRATAPYENGKRQQKKKTGPLGHPSFHSLPSPSLPKYAFINKIE